MIDYKTGLQLNPERKIAKEVRSDWVELIECIKDVESRLFPWYIPQPLYDAVRSAYVPETSLGMGPSEEMLDLMRRGADPMLQKAARESAAEQNTLRGKENLKKEIRDLLLRLHRLRKLFEAVSVRSPPSQLSGSPDRQSVT